MDIFTNPDYAAAWAATGALAQALATVLAMAALIYSARTFKSSMATSHYTELDRMYFDLLQLALDKPYLNDAAACERDSEKRAAYDIYAFMMWNFLETIDDRCCDDEQLRETWEPVLLVEAERHAAWFKAPENAPKFKPGFRQAVLRKLPAEAPRTLPVAEVA